MATAFVLIESSLLVALSLMVAMISNGFFAIPEAVALIFSILLVALSTASIGIFGGLAATAFAAFFTFSTFGVALSTASILVSMSVFDSPSAASWTFSIFGDALSCALIMMSPIFLTVVFNCVNTVSIRDNALVIPSSRAVRIASILCCVELMIHRLLCSFEPETFYKPPTVVTFPFSSFASFSSGPTRAHSHTVS